MSSDLSPYLALRQHLRVVHHVPGRIRLRLSRPAAATPARGPSVSAFLNRLQQAPAVRSVRLSAPTLSAVVEYDAGALPAGFWPALLSGPEEAALAMLHALLDGAP
ncbi:MAG: hypothetical protein LDL44_17305 [Caenispirillum sp.]|nr:hypothetical protein [Caenispirillum sp.]